MRLDVGFTRGQKVARLAGVAVAMVVVLACFPPIFGLLGVAELGVVLSALIFAVVLPVLCWAVLSLVRSGAWLEGTTVTVRSAFRTRRCDLGTARELSMGSNYNSPVPSPGVRSPRLVVKDVRTNESVHVPLRGVTGALLPPHQLRALAAAISAGARPPPDDDAARRVARHLTELADNPLANVI